MIEFLLVWALVLLVFLIFVVGSLVKSLEMRLNIISRQLDRAIYHLESVEEHAHYTRNNTANIPLKENDV